MPDDFVPEEEMLPLEEFKELKDQRLTIQPIRHGMIKKYFEKSKYQKKNQERLIFLHHTVGPKTLSVEVPLPSEGQACRKRSLFSTQNGYSTRSLLPHCEVVNERTQRI